jgi:hypothetical protein
VHLSGQVEEAFEWLVWDNLGVGSNPIKSDSYYQ